MSKIKERLVELNPELFATKQAAVENEITVVGRIVNGVITYLLKTQPNAKAQKIKMAIANFFHLSLKPTGTVIKRGDIEIWGAPKRGRVDTIFQPQQPELYAWIRSQLYKQITDPTTGKTDLVLLTPGNTYEVLGNDGKDRPMVKLRNLYKGKKIVFNCDSYVPHNVDEDGISVAFTANTRDPKTGNYEPKEVVMGSYEFFADVDDLDNLLEICARKWTKDIEPWLTGEVTQITKIGNKTTTEHKEAALTGTDDFLIDEYGNAVDDTGDVKYSKKELTALGKTDLKEGDMVTLNKVKVA